VKEDVLPAEKMLLREPTKGGAPHSIFSLCFSPCKALGRTKSEEIGLIFYQGKYETL